MQAERRRAKVEIYRKIEDGRGLHGYSRRRYRRKVAFYWVIRLSISAGAGLLKAIWDRTGN